ncbi:metallophosphoesterase [Thalassotalea montiporae]
MTKHLDSAPCFTIAQFSDSHLFADKQAMHYGADVYQNLVKTCHHIANNKAIDIVVFTGDLTQDHTVESYHRFKALVETLLCDKTVYFLAGNHDDITVLNDVLTGKPFNQARSFSQRNWRFHLLNSKSATPAGYVDIEQLSEFVSAAVNLSTNNSNAENSVSDDSSLENDKADEELFQFCFMHHHPVDLGYFIDRHGLTNHSEFWQCMNNWRSLKGIACGHVHRAFDIPAQSGLRNVPVYTCPATSIKFALDTEQLIAESLQPGYRLFDFFANGDIKTQVVYLT